MAGVLIELRIATSRHILQYLSEMALFQRKHGGCLSRSLRSSVLGLTLLFPLSALAEEPVAEKKTLVNYIDPVIDVPREYVSEKFVNFAGKMDSFFGNELNYQESNKSVLQFDLTRLFEQESSHNIVLSYRVKLHLPAAEKRLHLLLETNPDKNLPGATGTQVRQGKASIFKEVAAPDSYSAALRFENVPDSPWRFSADTGIKLEGVSLQPFARTRGSFTEPVGPVQLRLAESLFWFNTIGAGENTQFDAEYFFGNPLMFRATSSATWLHDKQNFDLRQDFSLYQTLDEQASLLYQLSAIGVSSPKTEVSEYVALLLYRRRFLRDWMFVELSPQLHYPKEQDYRANSQFVARLEILFSK
ncbi:MAG: hypothetical protein EPO42_11845 [Gallionellaceae bacterium]|nr:MAG: hypothetical protein EPO42_11845 [Gallionellaceae bacterium]